MKSAHFICKDITTSQNLALAALSYTTVFTRKRKLEQILIHVSQAITETITITLDSINGANYDTVLQSVALIAETDFVYRPQGELNLIDGDKIKIECTNANGVGTVYATIKTSEM
jgi:hypothetical protein